MLNVNSKILWLADYNLHEAPGGAQRSDQMIIDQGKILGFNILKIVASTITKDLNIHDFDVVISSNIHALTVINKDLINEISKHKCHIRLEHDSNEYLCQEDRIKLFSNCYKTVFLTEFHLDFFKTYYGNIFKNIEIIYDPIEIDNFKDLKLQREDKILYAGYLHPLKGAYEFFDFVVKNNNLQFAVAGWPSNNLLNHLATSLSNVEYLGLVDYNQMPSVYNKYKYMFYMPNLNEPFCRSVAEAVLCGMQIFTNSANKIGCLTEINKYGINQFREKCNKASFNFWNVL